MDSLKEQWLGAIISPTKMCTPRGYREEYIPSGHLHNEFLEDGDQEIVDELIKVLNNIDVKGWNLRNLATKHDLCCVNSISRH